MTGFIHSFESLAAVDGTGVRYAVFLVGCPLRCAYCHNPDTWAECGKIQMSAEDLVKKASRYKPYFRNGGGVTFSGGEPLLQADFINAAGQLLRDAGIGYILDTSGAVKLTDSVKRAVINSDGVLLDLKFSCDSDYLKYTGVGITKVMEFLDFLNSENIPTTVRTVVIPGINDTEESIGTYLKILRPYSCVKKYELLAFHTMGFFKYENLGIENKLLSTSPLSSERCSELQSYADKMFK